MSSIPPPYDPAYPGESHPPRNAPPSLPYIAAYASPNLARPVPSRWRDAAKASWVAPIIAMLLGCLTRESQTGTTGIIIGVTNLGLILTGLVLAVAALCAMGRVGREGILAPAIVGLSINAVVIGLFAVTILSALRLSRTVAARSAAAASSASASAAANANALQAGKKAGEDAFSKYPGWLGYASVRQGVVAVTEIPDDAPFAAEFRGNFGADFSVVSVAINNSRGSGTLTVDPSSLIVVLPDGTSVKALSTRSILMTAREQSDVWLAKFGHPLSAAPNQTLPDGFAFLPRGTNLKDATRMTILVNDVRVAIVGNVVSVEEKEALLHKAADRADQP